MLQQSKTNRWALVKYGAVAALTTAVVVFVAACEDQSKKDVVQQESATASSAAKTISGQILSPDGKPLAGANIELKNQSRGTSTDANGNFIFSNVPGNATLVVTFDGYPTTEIAVANPAAAPKRGNLIVKMGISSAATNLPTKPRVDEETSPLVDGKIFAVVQHQPEFPGGTPALFEWLGKNMRYPEAAVRANVSGRVFVNFIVTTDGSIKDVKILKGMGFGTDEEAKRIVAAMPKWKPAMQDGKPVNVRFNLPIHFSLEE
ncbi:TonB family protein [Tellurirhabdus bombi]|uniref:TonB family protein n=1 Tax=Tellurirhabdus bombi TaxID=2907205 RepID=UPI001F1D2D00|nr:TonB family protein [Tellurirhabdus bombi]